MYHTFGFFRNAMDFIGSHEGAKLIQWNGPYVVFVPIQQKRR